MPIIQWKTYSLATLALTATTAFSGIVPNVEQLQIPNCLAKKITVQHKVLAENKQFSIIEMNSADLDGLTRLADKEHCGRYINVSHKITGLKQQTAQNLLNTTTLKSSQLNAETYDIKHQTEVNAALEQVVADNIWDTLTSLTSMRNRSATKQTGVEAAQWLKSQFDTLVTASGRTDTNAYFVATPGYKQPSLVTVIGKDIKAPAVVIGAHMDTLDGRMPGAGDDGSGSSSVMEAARILLNSKTTFKRPIYIIWYAAEERGLVGSQYVVQHFQKKAIPVKAVAQFDMTGYRVDPKDPTMWVFTDYTDKSLSNYTAKLIDTYVHVPVDYSKCGYGCSDHASWTAIGVPSTFPCESNFEEHNPYIHTSSDTMDLLSLEHMTNFSKLALAFVMELALE